MCGCPGRERERERDWLIDFTLHYLASSQTMAAVEWSSLLRKLPN